LNTRKKSPRRTNSRRQSTRELSRLKSELAAERRRTARLERELADLKRQIHATAHPENTLRRMGRKADVGQKETILLGAANRRAHHYRKSSFLHYLWGTVTESAPVRLLTKLLRYLRRVRFVQTILTLLPVIMAFVAVIAVSAAVLPFLIFATALLAFLSRMSSRRMNRILKRELTHHRHIRVMIPPQKEVFRENSFFIRNARAMAAEEDTAVLVVTPYLFSRKGLGGRGRFFTARKETDGLYLVRRHYFFLLRRRVLDALSANLTIMY
jgi:hypothetical protein